MESWQKVWRDGFAPLLSTAGLDELRQALRDDDNQLIQGATTSPPPMRGVRDWLVEGTCVLGFCAWKGEGLETVGEIEDFFARACHEADQLLGEPAACRYFLNWFDDVPRNQMRRLMLREVERVLNQRFPIEPESPQPAPRSIKAA